MYTQDMTSFWNSENIVPNYKNIAQYDEFGGVNQEYALDRLSNANGNFSWLSETGPDFLYAVPRSPCEPKFIPRWDELSDAMSTSSSKCVSAVSEILRKYFDFNEMDMHVKSHSTHRESNWDCRNLSASAFRGRSSATEEQSDQIDALFEQIKALCLCDPRLMEKVSLWSRSHRDSNLISKEDTRKLSRGRVWITSRCAKSDNGKQRILQQDALGNLKGGYQETEPGVYMQPKVQKSDTALQHRLLRDSVGLWAIDKYDPAVGLWSAAARVQPDGQWVDCHNNKTIDLVILPMRSILGRLRNNALRFQNVAYSMEFLFTLCDHSKLNRKLKPRSLKHQINNTIIKLKKLNALHFAITVANTAQSMCDDYPLFAL